MKIILTSYFFAPSIGGIETVSALLAAEFVRAGHEVKVVTRTPQDDGISRPFEVIRNPGLFEFIKLARWGDVFFQNNISLELAWPLLVVRRPWVIAHHTWLDHAKSWKVHVKRALLRFASHATISQPITDSLAVSSTIMGDPYSSDIFHLWPGIKRDRELVYLGRLVSDKGIDLLVYALAELKNRGVTPGLTVIGFGPELAALREQVELLQLGDQIDFTGSKTGVELAQILNAHQVMIVPSLWAEPFGVVALEGIACGCVVVASQNGGLPEAIGPCGITFETGSYLALADAIQKMLSMPAKREKMQHQAAGHLAHFAPAEVAARYLRLFEKALEKA